MNIFCKVYQDRVYFSCAERFKTGSGFQPPSGTPRPFESRVPPPPPPPGPQHSSPYQGIDCSVAVLGCVPITQSRSVSSIVVGPSSFNRGITWFRMAITVDEDCLVPLFVRHGNIGSFCEWDHRFHPGITVTLQMKLHLPASSVYAPRTSSKSTTDLVYIVLFGKNLFAPNIFL